MYLVITIVCSVRRVICSVLTVLYPVSPLAWALYLGLHRVQGDALPGEDGLAIGLRDVIWNA